MKTKLLKRLRKKYSLQERNGEFKVFDNEECAGGIFNQTIWLNKKDAVEIRRLWILKEAEKYKKHKI